MAWFCISEIPLLHGLKAYIFEVILFFKHHPVGVISLRIQKCFENKRIDHAAVQGLSTKTGFPVAEMLNPEGTGPLAISFLKLIFLSQELKHEKKSCFFSFFQFW